jgi:hypothetical protein
VLAVVVLVSTFDQIKQLHWQGASTFRTTLVKPDESGKASVEFAG